MIKWVHMRVVVRVLRLFVFLSGMMVEVLGTVLGTAIQGQIVGSASVCPTEPDDINSGNSSKIDTSSVSLDDTVSLLRCQIKEISSYVMQCLRECYFELTWSYLSSETSVLDCVRSHLPYLHHLCRDLVFRCERAKRYESIK